MKIRLFTSARRGEIGWVKVAESRAAARSPDMKNNCVTLYWDWDLMEPADSGPIHARL